MARGSTAPFGRRAVLALAALALAGCVAGTDSGPQDVVVGSYDPWSEPGYPPKMGDITADVAGVAKTWATYDFSVGAFDASAWFGSSDGAVTLTVTGYPDDNPRAGRGLLRLQGRLAGPPAAGVAVEDATVAVLDGDRDWPTLSGTATLRIERLTREAAGGGYGEIGGSFEGALCPPAVMGAPCQQITGRFRTTVQFDGV